jgi:hypothetical protein
MLFNVRNSEKFVRTFFSPLIFLPFSSFFTFFSYVSITFVDLVMDNQEPTNNRFNSKRFGAYFKYEINAGEKTDYLICNECALRGVHTSYHRRADRSMGYTQIHLIKSLFIHSEAIC